MWYAIIGFALGVIIPPTARRLVKILPASSAVVLWELLVSLRRIITCKRDIRVSHLLRAYYWRCLMIGLVNGGLFFCAANHFPVTGLTAILAFILVLLLLAEIDWRTMLLPDVFTVPLLIGGFVFSVFYGVWVGVEESATGAAVGYLLPTLAAFLYVWRCPTALGGGDIKLLAAVGAWLGEVYMVYAMILSCVLFALFALVSRQRIGAFGPAISLAAIIVAFYFF